MLSREACEALKEVGFPQDEWPQMVWERIGRAGQENWVSDWAVNVRSHNPTALYAAQAGALTFEWIACPSELEALEWLEREKGWEWRSSAYIVFPQPGVAERRRRWTAFHPDTRGVSVRVGDPTQTGRLPAINLNAGTVDELIVAVCEYEAFHTSKQAREQEQA